MDKLSYRLGGFEGPLDLLLYLISKNKLNICDIELSVLVDQYVEQVRAMQLRSMDVASEFLEMSSRLIYLKTAFLLPKHEEAEELKVKLQEELMEYDRCRRAAAMLSGMTSGFDTFVKPAEHIECVRTYVDVHDSAVILEAYISAIGRGKRRLPPPPTAFTKIVARKIVSVSSKIVSVLKRLKPGRKNRVYTFFEEASSRSELIATFLAILELCKGNRVKIEGSGETASITAVNSKKDFREEDYIEYK